MKVMRSTKAGSVCGDCGVAIQIGDPIAYFGPRSVFGLTCHTNEKTKKHLARLLADEQAGATAGADSVLPQQLQTSATVAILIAVGEGEVTLEEAFAKLCDTWSAEIQAEEARIRQALGATDAKG